MTLCALLFQFFYSYIYNPDTPQPREDQRAKETLHGNLETAGVL